MTISLLSSDGDAFQAPLYACMHCKTIAYFLEEDADVDTIPLPRIDSKVLGNILMFFEKRLDCMRDIAGDSTLEDEYTLSVDATERLRDACLRLLRDVTTENLLKLLDAGNYLNCEALLDATSTVIAARISGKTRDDMRDILGIENDFTPEEEKQVLEECAWALN